MEYHLLGDINFNVGASTLDHETKVLTAITELCGGLHQLTSEPTRVTEFSSTLIDLIFTNEPNKVICSGISHIGISNHSLINSFRILLIGLCCKSHSAVTYRNVKTFDPNSLRNDIYSQNWYAHLSYPGICTSLSYIVLSSHYSFIVKLVFQLNLKLLYVKITNLLRVVWICAQQRRDHIFWDLYSIILQAKPF